MALSNLFGWSKKAEATPASACGAGDKPAEKPATCGSAWVLVTSLLKPLQLVVLPVVLVTNNQV